jgi:hypothetical protein
LSIDVINCRKRFWKNISAIILQQDFGKNVQNQNSEIEAKKSVTEWWFMTGALRRSTIETEESQDLLYDKIKKEKNEKEKMGGVEARRRCS